MTEMTTVAMAASVLNNSRAVEMSVFVVRAFVHLRDFARTHAEVGKQLATLERRRSFAAWPTTPT